MKNYLIVGASSGIGKSLAESLAKEGNKVYGTYCNHPTESNLENLEYHYLDVTKDEQDLSFLPETLDGFAYCPGSIHLVPFKRIKSEDFIEDFNLQVLGGIRVLQNILTQLKASKNASVVFFSTIAVQSGFNFHTKVAVSKGALEGLTKSLAAELSPTIRVNAIAPSITNTPLAEKLLNTDEKKKANADRHPLKKIGEPEDIANMAAFLLSDKAQWITGQIIHIDGGMSTLKI
ncbi:MAG: SDR family oxidoreductase [Chitinophagales bacterium]